MKNIKINQSNIFEKIVIEITNEKTDDQIDVAV